MHAATLLHDDVIDDGLTRRGHPAPRVLYGNAVSVLAGDWLLTSALDLAVRSRVPEAPSLLVQALRRLVEGEALQLRLRGDAAFVPNDALRVARLKTGALFGYCGEAGAVCAGAPERVRAALRTFGERCGVAFQIADDLLDFEADAVTLGKAVLADVAEGKASLPVAIALEKEPPLRDELRALLAARLESPDPGALEDRAHSLAGRIARTGALAAARRVAERERDLAVAALDALAPSSAAALLRRLGAALLDRTH
jgi:octaprenyl-diphosphate synthase